jgi:hypothetical protein
MRPSADFRSDGALLTIEGRPSYAIPGACVLGIKRLHDWEGEAPLDVLPLLGIEAAGPDTETARVALLDTGEWCLPLLVCGTLSLIRPAPGELLPLPAAMQSLAPLVSHIAVVNGKPSFYVLSPARLAHVHAALPPAPPIASR